MTRLPTVSVLSLIACLAGTALCAQESPSAAEAEAFTRTPGAQALLDKIFGLPPLMAQIQKQNPDMNEATRLEVARIASEEQKASRAAYEAAMNAAAAKVFTAAELDALTDLLATDEGRQILVKFQPLLQALYDTSRPELQAMEARIKERVDAELGGN